MSRKIACMLKPQHVGCLHSRCTKIYWLVTSACYQYLQDFRTCTIMTRHATVGSR